MVRYELILRRHPKLNVVDIPKRMADLPEEFSEGTLKRALENPDQTGIAVAWGDNRKRIMLIKRRIEILGGSAELVDRAGSFERKFTDWGDSVGSLFKSDSKAPPKPSRFGFLWGLLPLAAVGGALVYAIMYAQDAVTRAHIVRVAAFVLGAMTARMFVRGVQRWWRAEEPTWLAVCLSLAPCVALAAAGYEAYALGLVDESKAALQQAGARSLPKPLMKPFTALIVELQHRKERAELAAALASAGVTVEGAPELPAADASEVTVPTPEAAAELVAGAAGAGAKAEPVASKSTRRARKRKSDMKTKQQESANASGAQASPPTAAESAESLVVTRERALQATKAEKTVQPAAAKSGSAGASVGAVAQAGAPAINAQTPELATRAVQAGAPVLAADARAVAGASVSKDPRRAQPLTAAPAPTQRGSADPVVWEPLRSVGDINEIHAAAAVLLALLMFVIGLGVGRRRARSGQVSKDAVPESALEEASAQAQESQPQSDATVSAEPEAAVSELAQPSAAEAPAPSTVGAAAEWSFEAISQPPAPVNFDEANAAVLPPVAVKAPAVANDTVETAQLAAAANAERRPEPAAARKPPVRREGAPGSAYTTRGGVQEELVVRRRPDRRGD